MAKTKVRYCTRCGRQTVHKLVGHESVAEGTGFVRAIVAIASLGISEQLRLLGIKNVKNVEK